MRKRTRSFFIWMLIAAMILSLFPVRAQAEEVITVTVSVLGDEHHNSEEDGQIHTYTAGNLTVWVPATVYADVPKGQTAWELMQRVFSDNAIQVRSVYSESYGSVYVQGVTPPGSSEFLFEKDNGAFSGWMYKINGKDVPVGISEKVLKNGDLLEFHYTDDYTKEAFDYIDEDEEDAHAVEDLIDAIGTVTEESGDAIAAARNAYDALNEDAKDLVGNYDVLVAAEAAYAALIEDKASAEAVEALIDAIGTVTEESGSAIAAARNAYNALTDEQKAQVSNIDILTAAETAYDQVLADAVAKKIGALGKITVSDENAVKEARAAYDALTKAQKERVANRSDLTDAEAALAVEKKIAAIGTVTLKSEDAVTAARKAYNKLTKAQKERVSSYKTLTAAEKKLEELKKEEEAEQGGTSEDGFKGKGTKSSPYLIRNLSDLKKLQKAVNTGGKSFSGKYFRMTANITIPADWTPIGTLKKGASGPADGKNILPFSGTFDGNNHQLTVASGGKCLFGFVRGATIRNLDLYGTKIASDGLVANYTVDYGAGGTYTGTASRLATFENITIKKGTKTLYSGIIGASSYSAGGYSQSSSQNLLYFKNCTAESGVTIGYGKNKSYIGSFAGHMNGTMENCKSAASVYGKNCVGGLAGFKDTSMGDLFVENCSFSGSVTATGSYAGGIVGSGYNDASAPNARCVCIENCKVSGKVSGKSGVGGILGGEAGIWQAWENGIGYIRNNTFTGTVNGSENVGAILGYYRSLNRYTVIENNFYSKGCGAKKGIGKVLYVDSDHYANSSSKPAGWKKGVYCFDTSEDDLRKIKADLNPDDSYTNIARKNHNRYDDPLGKDAAKLTDTLDPSKVYVTKLTTSGSYRKEYSVGDAVSLNGLKVTAHYSDGSKKEIPLKKIKVSGFSSKEAGTGNIILTYEGASVLLPYSVKPKEDSPGSKTTVTVTVLGDSVHDSDKDKKIHGLSKGGLATWVAATTVEAKTSETVWDVLQRVLSANGITPVTSGSGATVYISALKRGGVTLGEFTNGAKSGWMYTVNGTHPLQGVSQRYIKNGDKIVLHYTDDYTKEENSEQSGGDSRQTDRSEGSTNNTQRNTGTSTAQAGASVKNAEKIYKATGDYLESLGDPVQGSVGGRWMALGLARSGRKVAASYYESVAGYVRENIDENERLHFAKSTDNSGEIIALTALGKDVTDVEGHDLLKGLTDLAYVKKQGINGPIWALIAFDTGKYEIPEDPKAEEQVTRETLIRTILSAQLADGGWALSGSKADADMTAMALTALAPYYKTDQNVRKAVDKALEKLSEMQNADGSFSTIGGDNKQTPTSESISQVLTALSALGIDGGADERFVKNGYSVLSALCEFYVPDSGFKHLSDGQTDGMATEQAYYALCAYFRMKEGKNSLYDMTDVPGIGTAAAEAPEETAEETDEEFRIEKETAEEEPAVKETAEEQIVPSETTDESEEVVLASEAFAAPKAKKDPAPKLILIAAVAAGLILLVLYIGKKKRKAEE